MIRRIKSIISAVIFLCSVTIALGQTATLAGSFNRFITYYISSIDINTGRSNVQLFRYTLSSDSYPVRLKVNFIIQVQSPALGLQEPTTLIEVETDVFELAAPIDLDNRDLSTENLVLYDVKGNEVDVSPIEVLAQLDIQDLEDLFSAIVQTGRLPDGRYLSVLRILSPEGAELVTEEQVINVTTPTTLQLTSPGDPFEQIEQNEVYTVYPVFQWESEMFTQAWIENCHECGFFIRVAEFRCEDHATVEDAIEGVTNLPLDQTKGWELVGDDDGDGLWQPEEVSGNQLTYMYPTSGAIDLRPGSIIVWQIQKRISTTAGVERINSPIYAFYVKELTVNPVMQALEEMLPEEVLSAYLTPCGDLTGYAATGVLKLDGLDVDMTALNALVEEFRQGTRTLITSEVR